VLEKRTYRTPGTLRFKVISPDQDSELIDPELQRRNHSRVGMPLNLTKYSRTDICNVLRELCKCMDGETMGTYFEIMSVIKFFLDTKTFPSKFDSNSKTRTVIWMFSATITGQEIQRQG
jgi:hypothetical protein